MSSDEQMKQNVVTEFLPEDENELILQMNISSLATADDEVPDNSNEITSLLADLTSQKAKSGRQLIAALGRIPGMDEDMVANDDTAYSKMPDNGEYITTSHEAEDTEVPSTIDMEEVASITSVPCDDSPLFINEDSIDIENEKEEARNEMCKIGRGKKFEMELFRDIVPEVKEKVPLDIDGTKMYFIECSDDTIDWQQKYKDGRYFTLNTSKRKGFRGVRKIGKCSGNYTCINDQCAFYLSTGRRNTHQFQKKGQEKFCYTCSCVSIRHTVEQ